jgi:regulator of cell morphogenesis and NO signaling
MTSRPPVALAGRHMETSSLAAALEREHQEIDAGIAAFAAASWDRRPLGRAIGALRRRIYLEEEFLFPLLREGEPRLAAPVLSCCASTRGYGARWRRWNAR